MNPPKPWRANPARSTELSGIAVRNYHNGITLPTLSFYNNLPVRYVPGERKLVIGPTDHTIRLPKQPYEE